MALIKCSECGKEISNKANMCPFCGCPLSLMDATVPQQSMSTDIDINGKLDKNRRPKHWILISCAVVFITVIAVAIIAILSSRYKWDDVILKSALPQPPSEYGDLYINDSDDLYLSVNKISFEEYEAYLSNCIECGYIYVIESHTSSYAAFNSDGYELRLNYYEYNEVLDISLDVRVAGIINWSTRKIAGVLPIPKSNMGSIVNDYDEHWEVYIGNTSEYEYNTYILECEANGFCFNTKKYDYIFSAENDSGYILSVEYYKCDLIHIDLSVSDEETRQNNSNETDNNSSDKIPTTGDNSEETLTLSEAKKIFENVFEGWGTLIDDFAALLEKDSFTSIEEIYEYEDQWENLSSTSYNLANELLINTPPKDVATEWNDFADKLMEIGSILFAHSTMDANLDGHYDSEEMTSVVDSARIEFVAVGEEITDIAKSFANKTEDTDNPSSGNSNSSSSHKCEECGKKATYSYTSPFSGEKEYYCKTHYDELMDMLENMGLK